MTDEERQAVNDDIHTKIATDIKSLRERVEKLENRMSEKDTQFAVINTKLSAILWGVGVVGTAIIGVLIKLIFGM